MASTFTDQTTNTYHIIETGCCGTSFGMPDYMYERVWGDSAKRGTRDFYCPQCGGLRQGVGETPTEKARREADRAEARAKERLEALEAERRRHSATKGQLTKVKKRVGKGACPCCNRHFADVERHMSTQHPDYVEA